jgi:hypothetical protein
MNNPLVTPINVKSYYLEYQAIYQNICSERGVAVIVVVRRLDGKTHDVRSPSCKKCVKWEILSNLVAIKVSCHTT